MKSRARVLVGIGGCSYFLLACIPLPTDGKGAITVANETAVIVWDPKTKTEHFIRKAEFKGTDGPMAFLVPTPTPPKLSTVEEGATDVFEILEGQIAPEIVHKTVHQYGFTSSWALVPDFSNLIPHADFASAAPMETKGLDVISEGRVGQFDTAVVRASNVETLIRWLKKRKFASDPRLRA